MNKKIYSLLGKNNRKHISIIEILQNEENWITIEKVSEQLKISSRSTQRYIHHLKIIIDNCNQYRDLTIQLHYEKFKGLKLDINDFTTEILKSYILQEDENIKLLFDICTTKSKNLNKYAEDNRLSSYAVRSSVLRINSLLKKHKLKISTNDLLIIGEEKRIRFYIYFFLWEITKNEEWPFDYVDENKIYKSIEQIEIDHAIVYSNIQKKRIAYFIAICLIRSRKNFNIKNIDDWDSYLNFSALKNDKEIAREKKKYQLFNENELLFLLVVIQMNFGMYQSSKIKSRILNYHRKYETDIYRATNMVFVEFQKTFFSIPKEYIESFYNYIFCAHFQIATLSDVLLDFDNYDVLETSPIPNNLICKLHSFIEKMRGFISSNIFYMNDLLIRRYLLIFLFFERCATYQPQITLGIDCDMPFFIKELFKKKIVRHFEGIYNLNIVETKIKSKKSSLIVTDLMEKNSFQENNICIVDYSLKSNDYLMIGKKIEKVLKQSLD